MRFNTKPPARGVAQLVALIFAIVPLVDLDAAKKAEADWAPAATPAGVTIENERRPLVIAEGGYNVLIRQPLKGRHYANEEGRSFYVFDDDIHAGQSSCTERCAEVWPPAIAASAAKATPGWSVVIRKEGGKQWALDGKPLYTYAQDKEPGDTKGDGLGGKWHLAIYNPKSKVAPPPELNVVSRIAAADGPALADSRSMTLYIFDADRELGTSTCNDDCAAIWPPAMAANLAKPHGDWTIVVREDGNKQWAFRGKPLYSYSRDQKPGESKGEAIEGWHAAMLQEVFKPANVALGKTPQGWTVFTTKKGMTLYARDIYRLNIAHPSDPAGPAASEDGRAVGPSGCSAKCTQTWLPLEASATAHSTGYWSVVTRDNGGRQWAYKGFPLYSYVGDKAPGEATGHDIFDFAADFVSTPFWRVAIP